MLAKFFDTSFDSSNFPQILVYQIRIYISRDSFYGSALRFTGKIVEV